MTIGQRIKEARLRKNLTQEELGAEIGLSQGAIGHFERDDNLPSIDTIIRASNVLCVSTDWLLGVDESPLNIIQETRQKMSAMAFIREISTMLENGKLSESKLGLLALLVRELTGSEKI